MAHRGGERRKNQCRPLAQSVERSDTHAYPATPQRRRRPVGFDEAQAHVAGRVPVVAMLVGLIDRVVVRPGIETRLADSFEQALKLAEGLAYVDLADGVVPGREDEAASGGNLKGAGLPPNRIVFSEKFACPVSGFTIEESAGVDERAALHSREDCAVERLRASDGRDDSARAASSD